MAGPPTRSDDGLDGRGPLDVAGSTPCGVVLFSLFHALDTLRAMNAVSSEP
jgi:hypothetical protein